MPKVSVFSQIIKLIPRSEFEASVAKHNGDKRTRVLDCWTWFGGLIFSQLSGHDSIRALEKVFEAGDNETKRLGFNSICRSTLSDANSKRPTGILEDVLKYALRLAQRPLGGKKLDFGFPVYLLDSTFIELCLTLCPWAFYGRNNHTENAGIKLHTAIDLTGHLPEFFVVKAGSEKVNNDLRVAKENFKFPSGSLVVFDRGYWSADYLNELSANQISFVTRFKVKRTKFQVTKSNSVDRTQGVICDQHIYLTGRYQKGKYRGQLRRVKYRDPETKKLLVFISNRFDLSAEQICALYKARWQIELFFRTLKQHLKIKKFLGLNKNAVTAQILAALISYVLLTYLKLTARSSISMAELMAVVATLLLIKFDILELIKAKLKTRRHPPPLQLSFIFEKQCSKGV